MNIQLIDRIEKVSAEQWNALAGQDYPFLNWHFLQALENSASVCAKTGWQPRHVLVYEGEQLLALMPMYLKSHSQGEYVFDHAWSSAYLRNGMEYFPKLLTAIPFTPCQGARICIVNSVEHKANVVREIVNMIEQLCAQHHVSSWHVLFPEPADLPWLKHEKLLQRTGVQFQWFNKNYQSFDDFLAGFTSKRRKTLKRERRKIEEQGISIERLRGEQISNQHWQAFFRFYQATYWKRGMPEYLNLDFFKQLAASMPQQLLMVVAKTTQGEEETLVAAALSLIGSNTLFGRYWGCLQAFDNLHFELCYYQGIEFCIEHRLQCFNSGAQGEHKIARGFEPVSTYSLHYIAHEGFRAAIEDFVTEEKTYIEDYQLAARAELPFNIHHGASEK